MSKQVIGVFVGSLRRNSFSRAVAESFVSLASEGVELRIIEIGNLPMYNQDLDNVPPAEWVKFREQVKPLDGVLFVTPEHNRSFPAALKNAVDVGSRPYGSSVWAGKAGGVVSVSPGAIGGFGANHHLRQVMTFLNILTLQQPEAYIGDIIPSLDENGAVSSDSLRAFLKQYLEALVKWTALVSAGK